MAQSERRSQCPELGIIPRRCIVHHFNLPVVFVISNGQVAVAGDLVVTLRKRRSNLMRMEVPARLRVKQADDVLVTNVFERRFRVIIWLISISVEEPVVVGVFVVVTGHLLLLGAFWVCLDVRMQKAAAVAHVF